MTRRQRNRLVVFLGGVIFTLCLGMVIGTVYASNVDKDTNAEESAKLRDVLEEESVQVVMETTEESEEEEELKEELPDDWNLILVNRTHPLPDDFEVELKSIGGGHKIDARAYDDYTAMIQAARKEGIYVYVTSSYRTMDKQIYLHEAKIEEGVMMGYSYAEAKERAAEVVAVPGTSEHQAGLALDIVSAEYRRLDEKQEDTKGFQWLKENCYDYGFILRYPNGKTDITGIIYEPWHFRYVGKKAAMEIKLSGQTLEEYLEAIPISKGTPVEYDSNTMKKGKKQTTQTVPVETTLPEDVTIPEDGENGEAAGDAGSSSEPAGTPVVPSAPEVQPGVETQPIPEVPVTPVVPEPTPEVPVTPVVPEPTPEVPPTPEPVPEPEPTPEPAPLPADPVPEPANL